MYWVSVVTEAGIFAILALGLDVIWGWGGDFDLAFYAYLALGSYMTMVLTIGKPVPPVSYIIGWRLPYPLALLLAVVAVVALAAVIGAIALRNLREIYFAVTTLSAVSALYLIVENYTPLFDGYNGVYGLINPGQTALNLTYNGYRIVFLGVVLVLLALVYLAVQRLSASPFGRMLRSVREDEHAAAAYGRGVFFAKYRAYLFGAALAGLAGGLFAVFISAFNPSAWTPQELLVIYAAILVGGRGNPLGVVAGRVRRLHRLHRADQIPARPGVPAGVRPGAAPGPDRAADHSRAQIPARGPVPRAAEPGPEPAMSAAGAGAGAGVENLSKSFGGIQRGA